MAGALSGTMKKTIVRAVRRSQYSVNYSLPYNTAQLLYQDYGCILFEVCVCVCVCVCVTGGSCHSESSVRQ